MTELNTEPSPSNSKKTHIKRQMLFSISKIRNTLTYMETKTTHLSDMLKNPCHSLYLSSFICLAISTPNMESVNHHEQAISSQSHATQRDHASGQVTNKNKTRREAHAKPPEAAGNRYQRKSMTSRCEKS